MRRLAACCAAALALVACTGDGEDVVLDETPEPVATTPPAPTPTPTPDGDAVTPTEPTPGPSPDPGAPDPLADDAWSRLGDAPLALTEVAAAGFGGDVWVAGGFTADGQATERVQVYDPTFDLWQDGPPLPQAVHHAALVSTGDGLMLLGGYVGSGFANPTSDVWRLDPATGEWVEGPSLPAPRGAGAAAFDGERVVYAGGVGPDGLAGDVSALEGDEWRALGTLSEPREHLAAASDGDGRVWFLAGRTGGLDTNLAAVDLVQDGGEPTRIGDVPTARGGLAGFYAPGAGACAAGGEEPAGTFAEVECIDADGTLTTLPPLAEPRHGLGAVAVDGIAYVVLGGPEPGLAVSATVEALRLE